MTLPFFSPVIKIAVQTFVLSLVLLPVFSASVSASDAPASKPFWGGKLTEPARPDWMQTDKALQAQVSVQAKGRPLGVVLGEVSRQTGVDVHASRRLVEQRVSLVVGPVSLGKFMGRLQDIFGHGKLPADGYEWERTVSDDKSIHYALTENSKGRKEEAAMLDAPRLTAERWLRQWRDYDRLPADKRDAFQSDWRMLQPYVTRHRNSPGGPLDEIISALTDAQIADATHGNRVTLPGFTLSAGGLEDWKRSIESGGGTSTSSTSLPSSAVFLVKEESPDLEGYFSVKYGFLSNAPVSNTSFSGALDTLNQLPLGLDVDALEAAQKTEKGPIVDLLAQEKAHPGMYAKISLPLALSLLAREAKMPIYAEVFLRSPETLTPTKGKPEYLLSQICRVYKCDWRKVGGDYLVYSRTWAQDRLADIPQAQIDKWTASREKNGKFTFLDLLEMARLTDRQLKTLENVFDFQILPRNRDALRFAASLSPGQLLPSANANGALIVADAQLSPAYAPQGSELTLLNDAQVAALSSLFRRQISAPVRMRVTQEKIGVTLAFSDPQGQSPDFYQFQGVILTPPAQNASAGKP